MTAVAGRPSPGALLLHPLAVLAMAILIVNDHVLKGLWGNTLTGKLSDVAGVFVFPLLALSLLALTVGRSRTDVIERRWVTMTAVLVTGVGFAAVKLVGPVGDAYALAIGGLRWLAQGHADGIAPIEVIRDPSDVLVLPILLPAYIVARRVIGHGRAAAPPQQGDSADDGACGDERRFATGERSQPGSADHGSGDELGPAQHGHERDPTSSGAPGR